MLAAPTPVLAGARRPQHLRQLQPLGSAAPQARDRFGTRWESDRVITALIDRLLDAAQSPSQRLSVDDLLALVRAAAANRQQRPDWQAHLQGRLAWVRQINLAKAEQPQRLRARIAW